MYIYRYFCFFNYFRLRGWDIRSLFDRDRLEQTSACTFGSEKVYSQLFGVSYINFLLFPIFSWVWVLSGNQGKLSDAGKYGSLILFSITGVEATWVG